MQLLVILVFLARCVVLYVQDWWELLTKRSKDITDKVVVITGGARGIGKEIARILGVEKGARLALIDINLEECKRCVEELREAGCDVIEAFEADVSDSQDIRSVAEQIRQHPQFGDVDILICNAAVLRTGYVRSQKEEDIRKTVDVNYLGYLWTIRAFLDQMEERNSGHILSVCSVTAFFGEKTGQAYSSCKHAVKAMMESLEWELVDAKKDGVKVTTAYPYFTDTPFLKGRSVSSTFWPTMTPQKCAGGIVNGLLKDRVEVFVPGYMNFFCYFVKAFVTQRVKLAARPFLNVTCENLDDDN